MFELIRVDSEFERALPQIFRIRNLRASVSRPRETAETPKLSHFRKPVLADLANS